MTPYQQAKELALSMGATMDEPEYDPMSRTYEIQVAAPDGMQWVAAQSLHLVCVWYSYIKGQKNEELKDLITRMSDGLEPLDETINYV